MRNNLHICRFFCIFAAYLTTKFIPTMIVHVASFLESLGGSFSEVPIRFQSDSNEVPMEIGGR